MIPQRFFKLYEDVYVPGRWHLKNPTDRQGREVDDPWMFRRGAPVSIQGRWMIPIEHEGRALDFSLAGLSVPIVHVKVASLLAEHAADDVQLIPVDIEGHPEQYFILVAIRLIRCIDEKTSRIRLWTQEDGLPHKIGQYASVRDMHIDPSKVGNAKLFRAQGWPGPLLVSDYIKEAMDRAGFTGSRFEEVNT